MKGLSSQDPRQLGRNRMVAVIGQGGMGRVLLGESPTGKLVAVKQIHRHLAGDPEFRARFQREVAASRQVTGAYTAAVVDCDTDSESPWLASEYIPGPSLKTVVEETGPLSLGGLRLLAAGLASALIEIHRAGLIHRDLKPANVLLAPDGPRVIDFGIARGSEVDSKLTATGSVIGSPAFMSPEQAQGHQLTPAADVFSIGAILAMAASGESPFAGTATPQVLYNVIYSAPETARVPAALRDLVERCLAKDPEQRPTPEQILDAVGQIEAEPVWSGAVRDAIAEHRSDSDWWVETTAKHARNEAQLAGLRRIRRRNIRILAAAVGCIVLFVAAAFGAHDWALQQGQAAAATDMPVIMTGDQWRQLDLCALLDKSVNGPIAQRNGDYEAGHANACSTSFKDSAGISRVITLTLGGSVSETLDTWTPSGAVVGWMPIYGKNVFCDRRVITQDRPAVVVEVSVSGKSDGCGLSDQVMTAIVTRLAANPPQLQLPANSILPLDPCALLQKSLIAELVGAGSERTGYPYRCTLSGVDATLDMSFTETARPDKVGGSSAAQPVQIDNATVYLEDNDAAYHSCSLKYLARPTRQDLAEVVYIYVNDENDLPGACDRAKRVFSTVLSQLPK